MSEPSHRVAPGTQPFQVIAPDGVTVIGGSYDNISAVQIMCTMWHAYLDRKPTMLAPQITVYDTAQAKVIAIIDLSGGGLP